MLRRALDSLRSQTFKDWICEVHNDDPSDENPASIVAGLGDSRIRFVQHEKNLGGTATFNLFFGTCAEPFCAVLEDDNWWEPGFLKEMLQLAQSFPDASVFCANMRLWKEEEDGSFADTGRLARVTNADGKPQLVSWGDRAQMGGAVHSHSATLFRRRAGDDFRTPDVPISATEIFRERSFPHPLVFCPRPLANFTITRATARSADAGEWAEVQLAICTTFAKFFPNRHEELWSDARRREPSGAMVLMWAGMVDPECRPLLRRAKVGEWVRLLVGAVRRPGVALKLWCSRDRRGDWWRYLEEKCAHRNAEAARQD